MFKYAPIFDGYNVGAVLKPGKQGIIQEVAIRAAGELGASEWVTYIGRDGSKYTFVITDSFLDNKANKTSLGELTRKEFDETMQRLNLPADAIKELFQCYIAEVSGRTRLQKQYNL